MSYLREEIRTGQGFQKIVGSSDALQYVSFRVQQVAPTDATVLILGETGTGKGMVAHAIHELSARKDRPMITVNCAALPANLIESELFGREKGAFTGAHAKQVGRFEVANGGTIFLDEIGEMPLELQAKLLRVLQEGEFERLGSPRTIKVDARVIASTARDLKAEIRSNRFREDLFYRLNVFPITMPPLRMRRDDIPQLVRYFVDKYARKIGTTHQEHPEGGDKIPPGVFLARQREGTGARHREGRDHQHGAGPQLADRLEHEAVSRKGRAGRSDLAAMERRSHPQGPPEYPLEDQRPRRSCRPSQIAPEHPSVPDEEARDQAPLNNPLTTYRSQHFVNSQYVVSISFVPVLTHFRYLSIKSTCLRLPSPVCHAGMLLGM